MIVTEQVETNEQIEAANAVNVPTVDEKSRDVSELVRTTFFFEMSFNKIGESLDMSHVQLARYQNVSS